MTAATERPGSGPVGLPAPDRPSRSVRGALAAFAGLVVLAVVHYGPGLLAADPGVARLAPVLLDARPDVRGARDLGSGLNASLFASGLRVEAGGGPVLVTTERSAPVMVLDGRVGSGGDGPAEEIRAEQRSLTVEEVTADGDRVRWGGTASMSDGRSVRVSFEVSGEGAGGFSLALAADAPVAGWALVLDPDFTDLLPPTPAAREAGAWWVDRPPTLANPRLSRSWSLAVTGGRVAVDRRTDGLTALHVWGAAPTLRFAPPTVGP